MPSFDVVSEINHHELANAIDQTKREVETRFDLKGTSAAIEVKDLSIKLTGDSDYHIKSLTDMLLQKLAKRGIALGCVELKDPEPSGKVIHRTINLQEGIDQTVSKKIVALIKDAKLKVQAQINGDKLRVTGKKKDDLQEAIAAIRASGIELPLQFNNFRD